MIKEIEKYKYNLNEAKSSKKDWMPAYESLLKEIYNQSVLFIALSKNSFNNAASIPLISTKDFNGAPALYIFSDVDLASKWMSHYRHISDDQKYGLIGAIEKEYDFEQVFKIAKLAGVQYIMLDEGGSFVGIKMDDFIRINDINNDVKIYMNEQEIQQVLDTDKGISLRFNEIKAIPLSK